MEAKKKIIDVSEKTKTILTEKFDIKQKEFDDLDINNPLNPYHHIMKSKYFHLKNTSYCPPDVEKLKKTLINSHCANVQINMDQQIKIALTTIYNRYPKFKSDKYTFIQDCLVLKKGDVIEYVDNDLTTLSEQKLVKKINYLPNNMIKSITLTNLHKLIGIKTIRPHNHYIFKYDIDPHTKIEISLKKMKEKELILSERNRINRQKYKTSNGDNIPAKSNIKKKKKEKINDFVDNVLQKSHIIADNEFLTMDTEKLKAEKDKLINDNKKKK
jgi:hypothetical protein